MHNTSKVVLAAAVVALGFTPNANAAWPENQLSS